MFCSLFTQSIYYVHLPQPVGKDKNTFVHLLKESAYPLLNAFPINPILMCFVLFLTVDFKSDVKKSNFIR